MGITFTGSPYNMTLRYWCFTGCLVHVSQHGQEIFVIVGLHSWHCLLCWWHHWLGCWHYHCFVSWLKSRPFKTGEVLSQKLLCPWSCFWMKDSWRLRFMFVVELLAGWVVFLQFFEAWRRRLYLFRHDICRNGETNCRHERQSFAMRDFSFSVEICNSGGFRSIWELLDLHLLGCGLPFASWPKFCVWCELQLPVWQIFGPRSLWTVWVIFIFQALLRTRVLKAVVYGRFSPFLHPEGVQRSWDSVCWYPNWIRAIFLLRNVAINEEPLRLCSFLGYAVFCWAIVVTATEELPVRGWLLCPRQCGKHATNIYTADVSWWWSLHWYWYMWICRVVCQV